MTEHRAAYRVDYEADLAQQITWAGLPQPVREHRFHPTRRWRFDFAWPAHLLALEIDGATWSQGRHTRGKGYRDDCVKLNEAALLGWRVLRVTSDMVASGQALEYVKYGLGMQP